jgi:hypothetical protein
MPNDCGPKVGWVDGDVDDWWIVRPSASGSSQANALIKGSETRRLVWDSKDGHALTSNKPFIYALRGGGLASNKSLDHFCLLGALVQVLI